VVAFEFKGKSIIINIIEEEFSTLKLNIKFKGKKKYNSLEIVFKLLFHGERISRACKGYNRKAKVREGNGRKVNWACVKFNGNDVRKKFEKVKRTVAVIIKA